MDFDDIDNAERQAHLDHLENELATIRAERDKWKQMSMELNDEAKNLRAERDRARGLYCEYVAAVNEVTPQDIANAPEACVRLHLLPRNRYMHGVRELD